MTTHASEQDLLGASDPVVVHDQHLAISVAGTTMRFHHVWLRDNCGCGTCRVTQSGERALFTADIGDDIAPVSATFDETDRSLLLEWNDGHASVFDLGWLRAHDYSAGPATRREPILWDSGLAAPPTFTHAEVVTTIEGQIAYLEAVRDYGVAVVTGMPDALDEVERFAQTIGHVRETAFQRIHDVRHDPAGYNVAHTALELKPHTDLPGYHWPPSIQLLHFLANEAEGGESTLTDGWAVLAELRRAHPAEFEILTRIPLTYSTFSDDEVIQASAPMIQLDSSGRVQTFRFSNQLAHPLRADFDDVAAFYAAYRLLGRLIDSGRHQIRYKARSGDLITVHGHRVLHGRLAFDPASGRRHLQDVYMEYDDLIDRHLVLTGQHIPALPTPRSVAPRGLRSRTVGAADSLQNIDSDPQQRDSLSRIVDQVDEVRHTATLGQ